MTNNNKNIYIFYSSDQYGVGQLAISVLSLVKSKKMESIYRIYIGYKGFTECDFELLTEIVGGCENCYIYFENCEKYEKKYDIHNVDDHITGNFWPAPVFYWLLAQFFIPANRFIQIDIDTIVQDDLEELNNLYCDTAVGGVPDTYHLWRIENENRGLNTKLRQITPWLRYYKIFKNGKGYKFSKYINTGVLLINVPELKKILLDVVFHTANYLQLNDQDVLNRFLTKDVSNIPLKFNFCLHMFHHYELLASKDTSFHPLKYFNMLENQLINEIKKATVIHCSLKIKPTYFFNSKVMSIITKFDSIADYIHALWDMNDVQRHPLYPTFSDADRALFTTLKKEWNEQIALNFPARENIYSYTYIKWGELWMEIEKIFQNL